MRKAMKGVSSIIGTFLVLLITVVLFSTIFAWVQSMPPPPARVNNQFDAEAWYEQTGSGYYAHVNITHTAGEDLPVSAISILIITENGTRFLLIPSDGGIATQFWVVGNVWQWKSPSLFTSPQNLTVQLINTVKNVLFWQKNIVINNIWYPPVITSAGTTPAPVVSGEIFRVWAYVYDNDLNNDSVYADLSTIGLGSVKLVQVGSTGKFESAELLTDAQPGKYACSVNATDMAGHATLRKLTIEVSASTAEVPLPKLIVERIEVNPAMPTRGETVLITAIIKNLQSTPATSATLVFSDYFVATGGQAGIDVQSISVPGYGMIEAYTTWVAQPGGEHIIDVQINNVQPGGQNGTGKNISVVVMPRILLVDDDGAAVGSPYDMGAYFVSALNSINVNYTSTSVAQNSSGPGYDTGNALYQLRYFDVVIWESGYTNNSLTVTDVSNLQRFLDNGGKLWLAGENILENVSTTFSSTYLGISGVGIPVTLPVRAYGTNYGIGWINASALRPYLNAVPPFQLARPLSVPASKPLLTNESGAIVFANQFKRTVGIYESRVVVLSMEFGAFRDTGDQAVLAYLIINWLSGINTRSGDDLAVSGMQISTLTPRYREPVNVSAVIRNNGDTPHSDVEVQLIVYANDVEVARIYPNEGQTIALLPYGDAKTVNFTWTPELVGIHVLKVMVDPYDKIPEVNERNNIYENALLLNQVNVIYTMLVVDDDGSSNNGGTLADTSSEIVNALQSLGYTMGLDMDVQVVPKGSDRNNSEYNISRYNCVIWNTGLAYNAGGYNTLTANDISIIQNVYLTDDPVHHAFILSGVNVLNDTTVSNTAFMLNVLGASNTGTAVNYAGNALLYGVRENPVSNGFEFALTNTSFGTYPARSYTRSGSALPLFWANAINHWDRTSDAVLATAIASPTGWHSCFLAFNPAYTANRTMIAELLLSMIHWCGRIDAKPEIRITTPDIYGGTNAMSYILLRELNPQVGARYVLKVNITNLGGLNASVTVRFLDGDTVIGARNVNIPPSSWNATGQVLNGKAVSEVMWVPLFAGFERITVLTDPEGIIASDEFIRANNNASQQIQVFFFYDDMEIAERTNANWNHDATLLNINGESALDFISRPDLSTKVISDWDWSLSGSTNKSGTALNGTGIYHTDWANVTNYTKGSAHTTPKAYWLPEVPNLPGITGERKPLDLYLVIDNSGSMAEDPDGDGKTKWNDLVDAVRNVILPNLTASDNITLIAFGDKNTNLDQTVFTDMGVSNSRYNSDLKTDNGPYEAVHIWVARSSATDTTKQAIVNYLTNSALGMTPILGTRYNTPIWDAIGVGIAYARYYNKTVDNASGIIPTVIVLSDGMDWGQYRGTGAKVGESSLTGNVGPDGGSEFFGPWRAWDLQDQDIYGEVTLIGTDFDPNNENWWPVEFSNADRVRWGLIETINSSDAWVHVPVYTVGLGVTHFEHPSLGKLDTQHYGQTAGTPEYWLWKIASTSAAKFSNVSYDGYFYASQSSQLSQIFTSILGAIGEPGDIRVPPPAPPAPTYLSRMGINAVNTTTLFYDGFESGLAQWTVISGTWGTVAANPAPYRDASVLKYSGDSNTASDFIRTAFKIEIPSDIDWAIVALASRYSFTTTTASNWSLQISVDGTNWYYISPGHRYTPENQTSTTDDEWLVFAYDITKYRGLSIYIRIAIYDASSNSNEFAAFDEFRVVYAPSTQSGSAGGTLNYTIPYQRYRFLTTPPVRIDTANATSAVLSFYTRYAITEGTNGGFLYLWGSTDGSTWVWDRNHRVYLEPKQPYNGNLKFEAVDNESTTGGLTGNGLIDIDGKLPYWCFNGQSAGGTYGWEKIEVDLAKYVRTFAAIRILFVFAQFGGVLPPNWTADMGWYIDDVQIRVNGGVPDYWRVVEDASKAHSGLRYWYYCSPSGYLPLGIDSSLYTIPIDLTRAYKATLIAFFKFNINDGAGLPPDGVRVEVSKDNGETWYSVTYGVRMAWGYSGRDTTTIENRGYYGVTGDVAGGALPQRYSGVRGTLYKTNWTFVRASNADTASVYDWVPSFTLVRLNCDLSGFAGNTVILRIRVFTNATGSETDAIHYASAGYDKGVFVDDVFVIGTSITHSVQRP